MAYVTGVTAEEGVDPPVRQGDRRRALHRLRRCIKICAHDVLAPAEVDEEESAKMFAVVANAEDCIGCEACGRTCKKGAFAFEPLVE